MLKEKYEEIYNEPGAIWTNKEPKKELKELIDFQFIKPCKTLDVGCGEGFNSIFLSKNGFDVTGIDFSEKAIEYAKQNAKKSKAKVKFLALDVKNIDQLNNEKFNLIIDWNLLHCMERSSWEKYFKDVNNLLNKNGIYLSVCFNEQSPEFDGAGIKNRTSSIGTKLYYSSTKEMKELFRNLFEIIDSRLINIPNKKGPEHIANYFLMKKK